MDLYEIFVHQNPTWSSKEIVCFMILLCLLMMTGFVLIKKNKIKIVQGIAVLLIYIFLFIVFASTVFTRIPTAGATYNLQLLWSYRYVIENHSAGMLEEILLNCVLLMPLGILLPFALERPVKVRLAFLAGLLVSCSIEVCQLVFHRGLFEWDDILHNTLGCVIGYWAAGKLYGYIRRREKDERREVDR